MDNRIFSKEYEINSININSNRELSLHGLLGILQDVASLHAYKLGFGYEDMLSHKMFWVLIAQSIKMDSWPKWHQTIRVDSWTTPIKGIFAFREFEIYVDDKLVGNSSTKWLILDSETRKPKRADSINDLLFSRSDYDLGLSTKKIKLNDDLELVRRYRVYNCDMDLNGHVNNTKYSRWVLNSLPYQEFKGFNIGEYHINFSHETVIGDEVEILQKVEDGKIYIKGGKIGSGEEVFTAELVEMNGVKG